MTAQSLPDLQAIIDESEISSETIKNLLSKDPQERARASIGLLTKKEPIIMENIINHVRHDS